MAILQREPAPITQHRPESGSELQRIVSKCLEKDAGRRYASARDLVLDLERYKAGTQAGAAKAELTRALALDPDLDEAWTLLSIVYLFEWDWPAAERTVARALELNPRLGHAHQALAAIELYQGRYDSALALQASREGRTNRMRTRHGRTRYMMRFERAVIARRVSLGQKVR